jgi:hypothetical protein
LENLTSYAQIVKINKPKYILPDELTQAMSLAIEQGLKLSKALEKCNGNVKEVEDACIQILIESITLILAAGELLKMHYAFPAKVLTRTIVDRVTTIQHIVLNGEKGLRDWKSNRLPTLANRMKTLWNFSEDEMRDIVRPHIKMLHKSTHGDAAHGHVNMGLNEGTAKYWLGPNPTRPEQCESVAMHLVVQLKIIDHFVNQLINEITTP